MEKQDISIIMGEGEKFNMRVAAIHYKDNKVMLQQVIGNDYISLVGGRVKLGEDSKTALARELQEELGVSIDRKRMKLQYICENFFEVRGVKFHEILFIYAFEYVECEDFKQKPLCDNEKSISFWVDFPALKNLNIKPQVVKKFYKGKPSEHIIGF